MFHVLHRRRESLLGWLTPSVPRHLPHSQKFLSRAWDSDVLCKEKSHNSVEWRRQQQVMWDVFKYDKLTAVAVPSSHFSSSGNLETWQEEMGGQEGSTSVRSRAQPLWLFPGPFLLSWFLESLAKKPTVYPAATFRGPCGVCAGPR